LSVAVSIIDTVPEPSLEAYAIGAATTGGELTRDNAAAMRIPEKRMVMSAPGKRRLRVDGAGANDRLCYTTLSQFL
jgi:hypothetical protein